MRALRNYAFSEYFFTFVSGVSSGEAGVFSAVAPLGPGVNYFYFAFARYYLAESEIVFRFREIVFRFREIVFRFRDILSRFRKILSRFREIISLAFAK